nr:hypothetical protein [Tanacetum cinerariifolium]
MSHNGRKVDQHAAKHDNERVLLASSIENLKVDIEANNKINKDLKKLNASLSQELWFCKSSNDMFHNYYLEEAKKKAQLQKDKALNSKPSVITPGRLPNTARGIKRRRRDPSSDGVWNLKTASGRG